MDADEFVNSDRSENEPRMKHCDTVEEKDDLARCEQVIANRLAPIYEVGQSFQEIRDNRLYRYSHSTFESYCKERWRKSRSYVHRLIDAFRVGKTLLPIGNNPPPASEFLIRTLARVDPKSRAHVWKRASEIGAEKCAKVTQNHLTLAIAEVTGNGGSPQSIKRSGCSIPTNGFLRRSKPRNARSTFETRALTRLSRRELEIVGLVKDGLSDKEIAVQLGVKSCTIGSHLHRIYQKLHVRNRTEAAFSIFGP